MCPLRVKPGLAHLDRQLVTLGKLLPEKLISWFVLKIFTSLLHFLVVHHKVHNSLLIRIKGLDVGHVPLCVHCYCVCFATVKAASPPAASVSCHFFLSWAFFLQLLPLASAIPPLMPPFLPLPPSVAVLGLLPLSCHPPLPPSLDICHCVPQFKFRNTVSGDPLSNNKQQQRLAFKYCRLVFKDCLKEESS